eukprot:771222-Alexandrium_andersonii.AAC.1
MDMGAPKPYNSGEYEENKEYYDNMERPAKGKFGKSGKGKGGEGGKGKDKNFGKNKGVRPQATQVQRQDNNAYDYYGNRRDNFWNDRNN